MAETLSLDGSRHSWKFGGDALLTKVYNFFPSVFGGEYIFSDIRVNPFTFEPMLAGLETTPLRAYAHGVPRYYIQNFGSAVSHPDTNEYSWFAQDTIRMTNQLALSLGLRYDLQTFSTRGLVTNPLWPDSGKVALDTNDFAPRVGLAYSVGNHRPLVIRAGYGLFYTRIPQIYTSTVATDNGISSSNLFLDNSKFFDHQVFPTYPNPLVSCALNGMYCAPSAAVANRVTSDISAFAPNFRTPKVSGRPVNARVIGDPNQDDNSGNDRLPGLGRNSLLSPNYASTDMRLTRRIYAGDRVKLELLAESFNLLNRDNRRVNSTDDGFLNSAGQFVQTDKFIGLSHFPAHFRQPSHLFSATEAYAPRQVQLALRLIF